VATRTERTGRRTADRLFSEWHGDEMPGYAGMIDIDWIEYCDRCWEPLVVIETAIASGVAKPTIVTRRLALAAGIEALLVLITPNDDDTAIRYVTMRAVAPVEGEFRTVTRLELRAEICAARARAAQAIGCPHEARR
jgi:hypothetical protein